MGLPMEDSYKTDPPVTIYEFSVTNLKKKIVKINPPKKSLKNYRQIQKHGKKGQKHFFTLL